MARSKRKLKGAKKDRYRVDTYVEDGIYDYSYTVHSYAPSLKKAHSEAAKVEAYEKKLMDHRMYHIDSAISFQPARYRLKNKGEKTMSKKSRTNNPNNDYVRGRKWGFAVMTAASRTSKGAVHQADKAMQTCARNARTGVKRLSASERKAYQGIADGMYDAIRRHERRRG